MRQHRQASLLGTHKAQEHMLEQTLGIGVTRDLVADAASYSAMAAL